MSKYKYEVYDHHSGRVTRGDIVAAFVPTDKGARTVVKATVVAINRNTIRVSYYFKGEGYEAVLKDHQWCHIMDFDEDIWDRAYIRDLQESSAILQALYNGGVNNWEGYEVAMNPENYF
jgi:hypothetical protein